MAIVNKIINEISQAASLRQPLLKKISRHFESRYVVSYYTSFSSPGGSISDGDVEMLTAFLSGSIQKIKNDGLLLLINSPGGDPLSAEKIVKICREFSNDNYWVLVPSQAKSAATMISLGASKLYLTPISELGPIDIQVAWKNRLMPAYSIIDAYDSLIERGISLKENERIEPILQQLQEFSAPQIESLRQTRELSSDIARKVTADGMFKDIEQDKIKKLLKIFIEPKVLKTHGRPIYYSDLKKIDSDNNFSIHLINKEDQIFQVIQEYHLRANLFLTNRDKLLESVDSAYSADS